MYMTRHVLSPVILPVEAVDFITELTRYPADMYIVPLNSPGILSRTPSTAF